MSRAERETVIRWDCEDRVPVMYTADPAQARRWTRLGYAVIPGQDAPRLVHEGGRGLRTVPTGAGRGDGETGQRCSEPPGTS